MIVFKTDCLIGCKSEIGHLFEIIGQEIEIVIGKGIEICEARHSHLIVIIEGRVKIMMATALHHWFASIPCHLLDEAVVALRHGANHG